MIFRHVPRRFARYTFALPYYAIGLTATSNWHTDNQSLVRAKNARLALPRRGPTRGRLELRMRLHAFQQRTS